MQLMVWEFGVEELSLRRLYLDEIDLHSTVSLLFTIENFPLATTTRMSYSLPNLLRGFQAGVTSGAPSRLLKNPVISCGALGSEEIRRHEDGSRGFGIKSAEP